MTSRVPLRTVDAIVGSVCLIGGVALAVTIVAVRIEGLWSLPTGLIRRNPVLMLGFSVCLVLSGSRLLWQTRTFATRWRPTVGGRRFQRAILFTRTNCPLCEEARAVLTEYQSYLPPIVSMDIDSDPELASRYGDCVPVVELDGRRRFTGQVNEVLLRRLIEGTPPGTMSK